MKIREKIQQFQWANETLKQLQAELDCFIHERTDIPLEPGGWWHQYVCPTHHTELLFDPQENDAVIFLCPHGCKLEDEPYRGAWLVFKHQSLARYALQSAAVYAGTGDQRYAEWSKGLLLRYAVQFPHYPVHPDAQPWMLRGHAFHQALTEALWATTLIRTYLLLVDEGVDFSDVKDELNHFFSMLEESMTQARRILVEEQKKPESNYTAWLNAALACVYALRNDREKMLGLLDGKAGLKHHLTIGVKPDNLEYEGSTYYHIFVLRAYLIVAEMASRFDIPLDPIHGEQGQSIEGMLDVLVSLANDRGELPAFHDGPYQRVPYAREIAETFEIGLSRFAKSSYVPILTEAYRQMYGAGTRAGLEALLFGEGELGRVLDGASRPSLLLDHSGFVVGRQPGGVLSFYTDFGEHGGSHGHYDKLHLSLEHRGVWIAPELGMVPYGSSLRKEWYATTASHNTILINGQSQAPHAGECVKFAQTDDATYCWLRSQGAYEGCVLNRHLYLTKEWLLDWFEVELTESHQIDWWMHSPRISPMSNQWISENQQLGISVPYRYVQTTSKWQGESGALCQAVMSGDNGAQVLLSTVAFPTSQLILGNTPGTAQDPAKNLNGLLHRQSGSTAVFVSVYSSETMPADLIWLGSNTAGSKSVEVSFPTGALLCTLHVDTGIQVRAQ